MAGGGIRGQYAEVGASRARRGTACVGGLRGAGGCGARGAAGRGRGPRGRAASRMLVRVDAPEGPKGRAEDHRTALSVAVVIGAQRERAATCLRALSIQTIADRLEVIVVDTRPEMGSVWREPDGAEAQAPWSGQPLVLSGAGLSYGEARAMSVGAAHAELIAFLEDHCYPHPGWAEALVSAYAGGAVAAGYAVSNANPDSLVSQIVHLATYGEWEAPVGGPVSSLPGGNVSYRRDVLVSLGTELADLLTTDFNLHNRLRERRLPLVMAPAARVSHESEERYLDALRTCFVYSRALAAKRASLDGWSARTRAVVAGKDLLGAPAARLARLVHARSRSQWTARRFAALLPAVMLVFIVSAIGEAAGYLLREGASAQQLIYCEVDAPRDRSGSRPRGRP